MADMYEIVYAQVGPMGIELESSEDGLDAFVVESSNPKVKKGHGLMAVNNEAVEGLSFEEILEKVAAAPWPRTLSFSSKLRSTATEQPGGSLPLPDGFFSDIAELTGQEEEDIKAFMNSHLEEALRFVTSEPESNGLRKATESNGIRVYLGNKPDGEGEEVQLVLSKVQIPIPADLMMNAAVTSCRSEFKRIFTMLDPMFGDGDVIHVIPKTYERYGGKTVRPENLQLPLYSVKWGAWELPFPLSNRDFVFCEYTCWAPNGYGVSMCMSIPKVSLSVPNLENSHNIVRGNMGMTGYFWKNTEGSDPKKPMGKNSMSIDLTYLLQINIKGAIPKWAVNLVGPQQGLNVKRVLDYALKQRDLATIFFDENTELNGFESLTAVVEKGTSFEVKVNVPQGHELVYEWVLEDHDVYFSIKSPSGKVIVPSKSHACNIKNREPLQGRFKATEAGPHVLIWDNTPSWFTNKTVYYHYVVIDPSDTLPWTKWPKLVECLAME